MAMKQIRSLFNLVQGLRVPEENIRENMAQYSCHLPLLYI